MPPIPNAPMAANQTAITGPKSRPTAPVPKRCTEEQPEIMTGRDRNDRIGERAAHATFKPSTADEPRSPA